MMFQKYPTINPTLVVGQPGNYKDITCVKFCYDGSKEKKKIMSNIRLKFSDHLIKTSDIPDLYGDNLNPSILYLHDIGLIFHSRDWKDITTKQERKTIVGNFRKRGIELLGSLHREMELEIEIRMMCVYFIYPEFYNIGDPKNMEDDIVVLRIFDKPDMFEKGEKPINRFCFDRPDRYARMYNTLEEVKL